MTNKITAALAFCLGAGALSIVLAPSAAAAETGNLALYRPVQVSSTNHSPTIAAFAVDGEDDTGWRSHTPVVDRPKIIEPQNSPVDEWLKVDLQAVCRIERLHLLWDTKVGDRVHQMRKNLQAEDRLATYATAYRIEVSADANVWTTVQNITDGAGGAVDLPLAKPVEARFVRIAITNRAHPVGVGLNEIEVHGSCTTERPAPDSWRLRRTAKVPAAPASALAADGTLPLHSGWEMTREDWAKADAAAIAGPGLDSSAWYNATVPGTVMTTLVDQGVFPDPVYGLNNLQIPEALSRHAWWYRTVLVIPETLKPQGDRHLWLEFDGINHCAEIWLNGTKVGESAGAFIRSRIDISAAVTAGNNVLAVRIIPPPHPGIPLEKDELTNVYNGGALGLDSPTFVASVGWDWLPGIRDRAIGIWNKARLRATGPAVIGDPQVVTDLPLPDTSRADVAITVPVRNVSPKAQQVMVTATFDQVSLSQTVNVPAGESREAVFTSATHPQLALSNPRLWWPNGYGKQDLYRLNLTTRVAATASDSRTLSFGVREFTYLNTNGAATRVFPPVEVPPTTARHLRMLGKKRATSFGYSFYGLAVIDSRTPERNLALKATATASSNDEDRNSPDKAVDGDPKTRWSSKSNNNQWLAIDLGAAKTFDRVQIDWEIAYASNFLLQVSDDGTTWRDLRDVTLPPPEQMTLAVNGVRVLCVGGNWGYPEALLRMPAERMDTAVRMHKEANLTMIRNWVGMTTNEDFYDACDRYGILVWNDFWLANPVDGPDPIDPERFMRNAEDVIRRYRSHPSIAIWCGRNEGNPPKALNEALKQQTQALDGTRYYQAHSAADGVSGFGPYHFMSPESYSANANGFKSEMGTTSVPTAESLRLFDQGNRNPWPIDAMWAYHDFTPKGAQGRGSFLKYMEANLGAGTDLEDFSRKAQLLNFMSHRAMFEAWNSNMWKGANALLLWMSHPAWPSTVWQIYDYWFDPAGAYFGTQQANEMRHIQANLGNWKVEAVNHTTAVTGGIVTATVLGLDAKPLWEQSAPVAAEANATTALFPVAWPTGGDTVHLLRLVWRDAKGKRISDNWYWRGVGPKGTLQALNTLPRVAPQITTVVTTPAPGRVLVTATVVNRDQAPALMLIPGLRTATSNRRVLPIFASDGGFTLLPGDTRTFTIECAAKELGGEAPKVVLNGWNTAQETQK